MARIGGVDLPNNKRVHVALTYIFGIGRPTALEICKKAGLDIAIRTNKLTDEQIASLRNIIENEYKTEGDLKRDVGMSIKRLMDLGCYRGVRHRKGLPVRGQRTRSNARTRKGPRKTVANKKKVV